MAGPWLQPRCPSLVVEGQIGCKSQFFTLALSNGPGMSGPWPCVDMTLNPFVHPLVCLSALLWASHRPGPKEAAGEILVHVVTLWWAGLCH